MSATPTFNQNVVTFLEDAGKISKEAEELVAAIAAEEAKVASVLPQTVDVLRQNGIVEQGQTKAASDRLSTHAGTLEVVQNLSTKIATLQRENAQLSAVSSGDGKAASAGEIHVPTKSTPTDSRRNGGIIGARRGLGQKSAADRAFENRLGIGDN